MYLRKTRPRGRGQRQIYWELVESYRTAKGSRQPTVAYLGKLSRRERSGGQKLSRRLSGQSPPMPTLFDPPEKEGGPDLHWVDTHNLRLQRMRRFGDVYLAWTTLAAAGSGRPPGGPDAGWAGGGYPGQR